EKGDRLALHDRVGREGGVALGRLRVRRQRQDRRAAGSRDDQAHARSARRMAQGGRAGERNVGEGSRQDRCRSEAGARRPASEPGQVQVVAVAKAPARGMAKKPVTDRIIDVIEWLAATFVGLVAADIFISVLLRKFFATSIPDSYDFGRQLLGILIF